MTDDAARVVLVTGAAGWLGSRLVRTLAAAGRPVRCLVRSAERGARLRAFVAPAEIELVICDLADQARLIESLRDVGWVFHLAAEKSLERSEADPAEAARVNVLGTLNVLSAARAAGVGHVVAASSVKASDPGSVLGATKFLGERILYASDAPLCTSVRLGGILASGGSVLERWRRTAREGGRIELTDPSMTRFHMTAGEAIEALLRTDLESGQQIIAPALRAYSLRELAAAFVARVPARVEEVGPRPGERTHEMLISETEAPFTARIDERFVLTPGKRQHGVRPYSSSNAPRVDAETLLSAVAAEPALA